MDINKDNEVSETPKVEQAQEVPEAEKKGFDSEVTESMPEKQTELDGEEAESSPEKQNEFANESDGEQTSDADNSNSDFEIGGHQNMTLEEAEQYKQDGNKEFADLQEKSDGEMTDADKEKLVKDQEKFERKVMGEENTRDILSNPRENREDTDKKSDNGNEDNNSSAELNRGGSSSDISDNDEDTDLEEETEDIDEPTENNPSQEIDDEEKTKQEETEETPEQEEEQTKIDEEAEKDEEEKKKDKRIDNLFL